jgi:hypothetical protein
VFGTSVIIHSKAERSMICIVLKSVSSNRPQVPDWVTVRVALAPLSGCNDPVPRFPRCLSGPLHLRLKDVIAPTNPATIYWTTGFIRNLALSGARVHPIDMASCKIWCRIMPFPVPNYIQTTIHPLLRQTNGMSEVGRMSITSSLALTTSHTPCTVQSSVK